MSLRILACQSFAILTFRIVVLNLQLLPILLPTRWLVTKCLSSSTKCLGCQYLLSNYWSWFHDLEVDSLVQALLPPNDLCTLGLAEISVVKLTKLQTKRKLAGWWKQFIYWLVCVYIHQNSCIVLICREIVNNKVVWIRLPEFPLEVIVAL